MRYQPSRSSSAGAVNHVVAQPSGRANAASGPKASARTAEGLAAAPPPPRNRRRGGGPDGGRAAGGAPPQVEPARGRALEGDDDALAVVAQAGDALAEDVLGALGG